MTSLKYEYTTLLPDNPMFSLIIKWKNKLWWSFIKISIIIIIFFLNYL